MSALKKQQKVALQLVPRNIKSKNAIVLSGNKSQLQLTVNINKRVASILQHLNNKWNSEKKLRGFRLFPTKLDSTSWGEENVTTKVKDIITEMPNTGLEEGFIRIYYQIVDEDYFFEDELARIIESETNSSLSDIYSTNEYFYSDPIPTPCNIIQNDEKENKRIVINLINDTKNNFALIKPELIDPLPSPLSPLLLSPINTSSYPFNYSSPTANLEKRLFEVLPQTPTQPKTKNNNNLQYVTKSRDFYLHTEKSVDFYCNYTNTKLYNNETSPHFTQILPNTSGSGNPCKRRLLNISYRT